MLADDMRTVSSFHDDFQNEKTIVEHYLNESFRILYRVWGQANVYSHMYTNFTLPCLCQIIDPALDSVSTDLTSEK